MSEASFKGGPTRNRQLRARASAVRRARQTRLARFALAQVDSAQQSENIVFAEQHERVYFSFDQPPD